MGIDLSMHHNGATVSEKRGNLFCCILNEVTGVDLVKDGTGAVIDNAQLREVSDKLNVFARARMAAIAEWRMNCTVDEAWDFVITYANWIESSAEAGHYMVVG
jgi:hypothetical protein